MGWTTHNVARAAWLAQPDTADVSQGYVIDWSAVDETREGVIESGTIVAKLANGKIIPRADVAGAETAIGFLVGTQVEGEKGKNRHAVGVLVGGVVIENRLPDKDDGDLATYKTELAAAGTGIVYETYANNA